jgi:nucleotide-binding universal stress UspA family protein
MHSRSFLEKENGDNGEASVEFVLAVLRQHEIEFEQIISQLELLVDTVNKVADQLQQKMENRLNLND